MVFIPFHEIPNSMKFIIPDYSLQRRRVPDSTARTRLKRQSVRSLLTGSLACARHWRQRRDRGHLFHAIGTALRCYTLISSTLPAAVIPSRPVAVERRARAARRVARGRIH